MDSADIEDLLPPVPDIDDMNGEQDYADYAEAAFDKVKYAFDLSAKDDWAEEKLDDNAKLWSRYTEGSDIKLYKRYMEVNAPLDKVVDFLSKQENMKSVNKAVIFGKTYEMVTEDSWISNTKYQGNFMVADRDVVAFNYKMALSDGSVIISAFSVDHPDLPEEPEVIRSDLEVFVLHFSAVSENVTSIMSVGRCDVKGYIPVTFINWLSELQHDEFCNIKQVLED